MIPVQLIKKGEKHNITLAREWARTPAASHSLRKWTEKNGAVNSLADSARAPVGRTAVSPRQISPNTTSDTVCSVPTVPPLRIAGSAGLAGIKTQEKLLSKE